MSEKLFLSKLERGKLSAAGRVLEDLKGSITRTRHLFLEGMLMEKRGKSEEAIKRYDMALVLHLSDPYLWLAKARVLESSGKYDMAKRAVERACRLAPEDPLAHLLYGKVLLSLKRYPEARKELDSAVELDPRSAEALTLKGILISITEQDYLAALTLFDNAIGEDENFARAWTNRGIALRQIGDSNGAIYSFQRALWLDPDDRNAGNMLVSMGEGDIADEIVEKRRRGIEKERKKPGESARPRKGGKRRSSPGNHEVPRKSKGKRAGSSSGSKGSMARGAEDRPNIDRDGRERSGIKKKRGKGPTYTERGRESRTITVTCPECERRFKIKHKKHMMFNCPGCGLEGELE